MTYIHPLVQKPKRSVLGVAPGLVLEKRPEKAIKVCWLVPVVPIWPALKVGKCPWHMAGFEGGQMPLARRLPKRGFTNTFRIEYTVINIQTLAALENTSDFSPSVLKDLGLLKGRHPRVKILGEGDISRPIVIEAHKFSESAKQKIENAGGQAKVIVRA